MKKKNGKTYQPITLCRADLYPDLKKKMNSQKIMTDKTMEI